MSAKRIIALLGRRDEPTDAVEEYCRYLGEGLRAHGFAMELARVPWAGRGWTVSLRELRQWSRSWRGDWVLVQYTALSWSARGFPSRFLRIISVLRQAGARIAVVYHDVEAYEGARLVDKLRRAAQLRAMRQASGLCDLAIFTEPLDKISWLPATNKKSVFIPVGANLPDAEVQLRQSAGRHEGKRVAVFGVTGGEAGKAEMALIADGVQFVAKRQGALELVVFGRNSETAKSCLCEKLQGVPVRVRTLGVLPAEAVVRELSAADVLLFVRGPISSRRGSAIAGIACGLPVIAYAGPGTAPPITDAGVVLVDRERPQGFGEALVRVLEDEGYRAQLCERSRAAQSRHFSWKAIAARYAEALSVCG